MKRGLKKFFLMIACLASACLSYGQTRTKTPCCGNGNCEEKVVEYAKVISGLANFLGNCNNNDAADSLALEELRHKDGNTYNELIRMVRILDDYIFNDKARFEGFDCFANALPPGNGRNVMCWINFIRFHILKVKPIFPSTEFCGGWKKRFEIGQGATAFLKLQSAYLGSVRAYLIYTFFKKDQCGGKFRIMAGPAFFLRSTRGHITLSSRLAYKLTDLKANVFSLGNLNLFAGYNSNFNRFNYAEGGLEIELGPFGVNLGPNVNTNNGKWGFMVGVFFANKKKSKTKK
jgi:hypothetical protein